MYTNYTKSLLPGIFPISNVAVASIFNNCIESLNAEFDELKSSHDEMTMKYRDLSQTVQMKCTQLELEIATFKDMVENLNRFDMLHPTAYGCLFESLNQLRKVKDDLSNLIDRDATTADTEDVLLFR